MNVSIFIARAGLVCSKCVHVAYLIVSISFFLLFVFSSLSFLLFFPLNVSNLMVRSCRNYCSYGCASISVCVCVCVRACVSSPPSPSLVIGNSCNVPLDGKWIFTRFPWNPGTWNTTRHQHTFTHTQYQHKHASRFYKIEASFKRTSSSDLSSWMWPRCGTRKVRIYPEGVDKWHRTSLPSVGFDFAWLVCFPISVHQSFNESVWQRSCRVYTFKANNHISCSH